MIISCCRRCKARGRTSRSGKEHPHHSHTRNHCWCYDGESQCGERRFWIVARLSCSYFPECPSHSAPPRRHHYHYLSARLMRATPKARGGDDRWRRRCNCLGRYFETNCEHRGGAYSEPSRAVLGGGGARVATTSAPPRPERRYRRRDRDGNSTSAQRSGGSPRLRRGMSRSTGVSSPPRCVDTRRASARALLTHRVETRRWNDRKPHSCLRQGIFLFHCIV